MARWLTPEEQQVWRHWLEVSTRSIELFDSRLQAAHGLALTDYEILVFLSEAPDHKLRMSELADLVFVSRSRLTYRVDRLVERGLVVREEAENDKRGLNALLTEVGLKLLQQAAPDHLEDVREVVFDHLGEGDVTVLNTILGRLQAHLTSNAD